jgi:hypothetical protein
MKAPRDLFGLGTPGSLVETEERKRRRIVVLKLLAADLFEVAVAHLGQSQAKKLFAAVTKRARGRPKGPSAPNRDRLLLKEYDAETARHPQQKVKLRALAGRLYERHKAKLGNSPAAIEKHLRKLVDSRKLHDAALERILRQYWPEFEDARRNEER